MTWKNSLKKSVQPSVKFAKQRTTGHQTARTSKHLCQEQSRYQKNLKFKYSRRKTINTSVWERTLRTTPRGPKTQSNWTRTILSKRKAHDPKMTTRRPTG